MGNYLIKTLEIDRNFLKYSCISKVMLQSEPQQDIKFWDGWENTLIFNKAGKKRFSKQIHFFEKPREGCYDTAQ